MPAFGQVQGEVAAAVAGDAGGDADELAADGRAAGFRVKRPRQRPRRRGSGYGRWQPGQPRGVRREMPGWQVSKRPVAARSAKTCSMMAWSRCCASAWIISNGESVNRAW